MLQGHRMLQCQFGSVHSEDALVEAGPTWSAPSSSRFRYTPPTARCLWRLGYCTTNSAWFHAGAPPLLLETPSPARVRAARNAASSF